MITAILKSKGITRLSLDGHKPCISYRNGRLCLCLSVPAVLRTLPLFSSAGLASQPQPQPSSGGAERLWALDAD